MDSIRDRLPATLTTDRLLLTTPVAAHVPQLAVLANNRAIYEVLARLPHPYAEADGHFFVDTIARGETEFAWAILSGDSLIGVISLILEPGQPPELGYWLGQPYWGQGFGSEAARAVVAAAKAAGATGLMARALTSNQRSRKVLAKAGFVETHEGPAPRGTNQGQPTTFMQLDFAL